MSIGTENTVPPPTLPPGQPVSECERFIETRLRETRRHVKSVDVAYGLLMLAIGVLAYLFLAAMIDQWMIVGGLGIWGRLLFWLGLIVGGGAFFATKVWPPLWHRINPVYAASTIEKSEPKLRNSLVNLLLLRRHRQEVAPAVFQAMEYRAASDLSKVKVELTIDRSHVVRLGCVLAALTILFAIYIVASPKNPLRSVARVLFPWSSIEAPTRVTIRDVQPGSAAAFLGDSVTISAEVAGLREGEVPTVVYSTADGQLVEQSLPMSVPSGGYRYQCSLPPGNLGLQQDYTYFLAAGDARSRRYRIETRVAPSIDVKKVTYRYPEYTGVAERTVDGVGDLSALEGTQVVIQATANSDIKPGSAEVDLGCTGRNSALMTAEGRTASGTITLRLAGESAKSEYDSYQLRFKDMQGRDNNRPVRHRIEVARDLPPEVQVIEPEAKEVRVPEDGSLEIKVRAADPDFGLRRVVLRAERDGRGLLIDPLLDRPKPEKALAGEFRQSYAFKPARWGLKAGDEVQYWVEAEDNMEPTARHAETKKQWVKIVARESQQQNEQNRDGAKERDGHGDNPQAKQSNERRNGKRGSNQQDEQTPESQANRPSEDGKQRAGDPQNRSEGDSHKPDQNPQGQQSDQNRPKDGKDNSENRSGKPGEDGQESSKQSGEQGDEPKQQGQQDSKQSGDPGHDGQSGGEQSQNSGDRGNDGKQSSQPKKGQQSGDPSQQQSGEPQQGSQPNGQQDGSQQGNQQSGKQQGSQQQNSQQQGSQPQKGGQQEGQQQGSQQANEHQKIDPNTAPGDAIEQILKDRKKQDQGDGQSNKAGSKQDAAEKPSSKDDSQQGNRQQQDGQTGDSRQSDGGQGEDRSKPDQHGSKDSEQGKQGDNATGENPAGKQSSPEQAGAKSQRGSKPDGKNQSGQNQDGKSSEDSSGGGQPKNADGKPQADSKDKPQGDGGSQQQNASDDQRGAKESPSKNDKPAEARRQGDASGGQQKPGSDQSKPTDDKTGEPGKQQTPGAGKPSDDNALTPESQDANQDRAKKPGQAESKSDQKDGSAPSPSISKKQSDSEGQASGSQSGGGEKGGGQQSKQSGTGGAGTHSPAEEGGSASDQEGPGQASGKAGPPIVSKAPVGASQMASKTPTGTRHKLQSEKGKPIDEKPQGDATDSASADGSPQDSSSQTGQASGPASGQQASNKPTDQEKNGAPSGGNPGNTTKPSTDANDAAADEANLDYARRQTELALEHLRDQMAKDKPELLDRLGWTKDDARRFLERWEGMKRASAENGPTGDAARRQFNDALKSLGLRPTGTVLRHGGVTREQPESGRNSSRFAPPPEWADQLRAYTRGVADPGSQKESGSADKAGR